MIELTAPEQTITFEGISERPVLSINRDFSAPVKVIANLSPGDRLFLLAHDSDAFNRWEAGQAYMTDWLMGLVSSFRKGGSSLPDSDLEEAFGAVLENPDLDDAFKIKLLSLPGQSAIANHIGTDVDPAAIDSAHRFAKSSIANALEDKFLRIYGELGAAEEYSPDAENVGRRALRNGALDYLVRAESGKGLELAVRQAAGATNLNDKMAALTSLALVGGDNCNQALDAFYAANKGDHLLVDKWLTLNALKAGDSAIDDIRALTNHEAFSLKRPNKVRSLIGAFSMLNQLRFNDESGEGFRLVADIILRLDEINPQVAARMSTCFKSWAKLEPKRRDKVKSELERIAGKASLSRDLREMTERTLKG